MSTLYADHDPWLKPHKAAIVQRIAAIAAEQKRLLGDKKLTDFALGHLYFGLHTANDGWVLREWAPNATDIFLVGECNEWAEEDKYRFTKLKNGMWELHLKQKTLRHGQHYKLRVHWHGGSGDRIPSYATYVVQDPITLLFNAIVWAPKTTFAWQAVNPPRVEPPLIYEAHVGMSGEKPAVSTYKKFAAEVLPRIKSAGYNTVQLMAIQEHPYYGSFGYHISSFFAVSSRFGTPDDFKQLVDTAHSMGLRVIVDIVHSHAAKNEAEGLSRFDGTLHQYFHKGERGNHKQWDSRVFDYGKPEVYHFLLSNCRFWLEEYHIDGFRFDGITSMLYTDHGLERAFGSYDDYFGDDIDINALGYLSAANDLIHTVNPEAITIAEDMSGMPGLVASTNEGGNGFDYRLNMGVPDIWIKTLKEQKDEQWDLAHLFHELTTKRPEEQTISYAESHDQALVGDKTLLFRMLEAAIYEHMQLEDNDLIVERGIALHKMIRLLTASTHNGGYLNFMGNEFGHPEWIDFPREGNDWSYQYARRQWSLADNPALKYSQLAAFDRAMIDVVQQVCGPYEYVSIAQHDHVLSFVRDGYLFAYNFSPTVSLNNYSLPAPAGSYCLALSSDTATFGGQDRVDPATNYFTEPGEPTSTVSVYLPARTALVLQRH